MPTGSAHPDLISDNIHSGIAFVLALLASWIGSAFSEINANLPIILQYLAGAVAVTTILRNIIAVWMRRP